MFFVGGLTFSTWAARIPAIQATLRLSDSMLGSVLLGLTIGAIVAMPFAGWLIVRSGSQRVTTVAAVIHCLTLPLLALATGPWSLLLALTLTGAANGILNIAMNDQAVAVEKRYRRPIMSSFHALFSLGGMAGAAIGASMAHLQVIPRWHFAGIAVLASLLVIAALRFLLVTEPSTQENPPLFVRPKGHLVGLAFIAFCVLLGEGAMADWSAVYMAQAVPREPGLAPLGYAAFSGAMALGRVNGDWLIARLGPLVMLRMGGILAAVGLSVALLFNQPSLVLAGFAFVGFGFSTIVPIVFSAAGSTPGMPSSTALAAVTTLGYFGFLAGPPVIGWGAEWITLRGSLMIVIVLSLMIAVLAASVRRGE